MERKLGIVASCLHGLSELDALEKIKAAGFEKVDAQIAGMGSIPAVQKIYVEHAGAVVE